MRTPIRHDVHRPAATSRADESPTPNNCREQNIVVEIKRRERKGRRVQPSRVRAGYEEAFESVHLEVRDGGRGERHDKLTIALRRPASRHFGLQLRADFIVRRFEVS